MYWMRDSELHTGGVTIVFVPKPPQAFGQQTGLGAIQICKKFWEDDCKPTQHEHFAVSPASRATILQQGHETAVVAQNF